MTFLRILICMDKFQLDIFSSWSLKFHCTLGKKLFTRYSIPSMRIAWHPSSSDSPIATWSISISFILRTNLTSVQDALVEKTKWLILYMKQTWSALPEYSLTAGKVNNLAEDISLSSTQLSRPRKMWRRVVQNSPYDLVDTEALHHFGIIGCQRWVDIRVNNVIF